MGVTRITTLIVLLMLGMIGICNSSFYTTTNCFAGNNHLQIQFLHRVLKRQTFLLNHLQIHSKERPFDSITRKNHYGGSTLLLCSNRNISCRNVMSENAEHTLTSYKYIAYLAVGSNIGDRFQNIRKALQLLEVEKSNVRLTRTSFLYETKPMYVTDQPAFLNGAVEIQTNLDPFNLLRYIKIVEAQLGRDFTTIRNGPRPVDLDILTYAEIDANDENVDKSITMDTKDLTIPHPGIHEREFVLIPFLDVISKDFVLPRINLTLSEALSRLKENQSTNSLAQSSAVRVLPLPRGRLLYFNETMIMGILNVTPDSFSDGGQWTAIDVAVTKALHMEREGAIIVDVGGESTRPGAIETSIDKQIRRTIPVIEGIRNFSDVVISIDTRHAEVAAAAIKAGADIVNDVSGGTFDTMMLQTVGQLGVPMILMHMRGTPETMQTLSTYDNVVDDVARSLLIQSTIAAQQHSIHRWQQIVDPGIGFAKDLRGNLLLLKNLGTIRSMVSDLPLLIGTSRKGFIGKIASVPTADERDPGTVASCITALCLEDAENKMSFTPKGNILRVHNVAHCRQAILVTDAIRNVV